MLDFHMHTEFSSDSVATMESMVLSAIQKKIKRLCFTEHVEFDPAPPFEEEFFDPAVYLKEIERLRLIYGTRIQIHMGAEIGFQPHVIPQMDNFADGAKFDFILCSLHSMDKQDFHTKAFSRGRTTKEAFRLYFEGYYECAVANVDYDCLGHFDILKRYMPHDGKKIFTDNFDVIESTFKKVIENGRGIEVNTSGYRYKLGHTLPTRDILTLYKDLGGEIITTGSDAHNPKHVAHHFKETYAMLHDIGFKYVSYFDQRQPKFESLMDVKETGHISLKFNQSV